MKLWIRGALFSLAIFLTVALAPVSRWVVLNQIDLFTRQSVDTVDAPAPISSFLPQWVFRPQTYSFNSPDAQIMRALCQGGSARQNSIWAYAASHSTDVNGWALQARMAGIVALHFPDQTRSDHNSPDRDATLEHGLDACRQGDALEPGNAYFSLLGATFSAELGDLPSMQVELEKVGRSTFYSSHIRDQEKAMDRAIFEAKGYRGEMVHMGVDASILFPDFAHIKALGKYLNRTGSLRQKLEMLNGVKWMSVDEDTGIGVIVAVATTPFLTRPNIVAITQGDGQISDTTRHQWAEDFDHRASKAGLVEPAGPAAELSKTEIKLRDAAIKVFNAPNIFNDLLPAFMMDGPSNSGVIWVPVDLIAPFIFLFAAVFCGLFSLAGRYFGVPWPGAAKKLMPLAALFLIGLTLYGMVEKQSTLPGLSAPLMGFAVLVYVIGLAFMYGFGGSNRPARWQKVGTWVSAIAFGLLCLTAGMFAAAYTLQAQTTTAWLVGGGLSLSSAIFLAPQKKDYALTIGGAGVILFSACYLVFVGRQIVDNREELLARQQFMDEGARIRSVAGLPG